MMFRLAACAVMLAACSRAPDVSASRLVGTWRPLLTPEQEKDIRESSGCSASDDWKPGMDPVDHYRGGHTLTFAPSGTWETRELARDPTAPERHWRIVEQAGDRIVVALTGDPLVSGESVVTYVFASPDRIEERGAGKTYARADR